MNTSNLFTAFFVLFLISSANAHMKITDPLLRGNKGATADVPPCGGFNEVNTTAITEFPTNGEVKTIFGDGNGSLTFNYAPTSNDTFKSVSDNSTVVVPENNTAGPLAFPIKVDLSKAGAKPGDQGVLQAVYVSADGKTTWYQCADIKVVDSKSKSNGGSSLVVTSVTFFIIVLTSFVIAF